MSKLDPTYARLRQNSIATEPVAGTRSPSNRAVHPLPEIPVSGDRVTLSQAGLAAAARFSNLVQRPAAMNTPALPAPLSATQSPNPPAVARQEESPLSRDLVRQTYAQGQDAAAPGSQLSIRA